MGGTRPGRRPVRRLPLTEAAEALGTSQDALRMRVRRGSIEWEKGEDGRVYVFLEPDQGRAQDTEPQAGGEGFELLLEDLRDQVGYRRDQLRREQDAHAEARKIIAALTQRIPEIEPAGALQDVPSEPREAPTEATEQPGRVGPQPSVEGAQEPAEPRSWWQRIFG
ncbi:MAG: hypothetical protein M3305_15530 [Actinomycetota bacterium]|nr:hypothetical protein [Actinomycetota bacterium]